MKTDRARTQARLTRTCARARVNVEQSSDVVAALRDAAAMLRRLSKQAVYAGARGPPAATPSPTTTHQLYLQTGPMYLSLALPTAEAGGWGGGGGGGGGRGSPEPWGHSTLWGPLRNDLRFF